MSTYPIIDHEYDVIVVGAGGSGLRAAVGLAEAGLNSLYFESISNKKSHCCSARRNLCCIRKHVGGRLALAYV